MCASRFVSICLCVCSTEPSQKLQLLSLSLVLCGLHRTCPPSLLPRASFPVPLSLPAAASLDFVSDFPRKGLCGGHGVKNTTFLTHSLGKTERKASPSLRVGLTCCLFYLPEPVTWFRVLKKFQLCHVITFACSGPCSTNHACSTLVSGTFQRKLQVFINAFPTFLPSRQALVLNNVYLIEKLFPVTWKLREKLYIICF